MKDRRTKLETHCETTMIKIINKEKKRKQISKSLQLEQEEAEKMKLWEFVKDMHAEQSHALKTTMSLEVLHELIKACDLPMREFSLCMTDEMTRMSTV